MKRCDFTPPKGFTLPEGSSKPGDEFSMLCDFRVTPTGLCMTKLGDMPMGDEKSGHKQSYEDYTKSMQGEMAQPTEGAA